jgi:hypothetical protein
VKDYKTPVLIIGVILIANYCSCQIGADDRLSLQKKPYNGNELKIDGYYYLPDISGNITIYFFFRNGILLYGTGALPSELPNLEKSFKDGQFYSEAKDDKTFWGVFNIDSQNIQFDKWYSDDIGPLRTSISSGKILNDTTFYISNSSLGNEYETFHFKQFSPKPDSITQFIP